MANPTYITIYDGKYTLILDPGNMRALRYGQPWRSLVGDGFVMALGQEIEKLREIVRDLVAAVEPLEAGGTPVTERDAKLRQAMIQARAATLA